MNSNWAVAITAEQSKLQQEQPCPLVMTRLQRSTATQLLPWACKAQEETGISAELEGEQPLELSQWAAKPACIQSSRLEGRFKDMGPPAECTLWSCPSYSCHSNKLWPPKLHKECQPNPRQVFQHKTLYTTLWLQWMSSAGTNPCVVWTRTWRLCSSMPSFTQRTAAVKGHAHTHTYTQCFHYPELSTSYATLSWKNEWQSSYSNWITASQGKAALTHTGELL